MFNRNSKRRYEVRTYSNEVQTYGESSSKLFAGYLWLNRPHKKQKWKRVFTCLYSSPALTYLVWWANKHENQIRGFLLLNDYDVVHYLANSICIKPNCNLRVQIILKADNAKDTNDWITHLRRYSTRNKTVQHLNHSKRSSLTDEEESCCDENNRHYSSNNSIPCMQHSTQLEGEKLDRLKVLIHWTYLYNGIISRQDTMDSY